MERLDPIFSLYFLLPLELLAIHVALRLVHALLKVRRQPLQPIINLFTVLLFDAGDGTLELPHICRILNVHVLLVDVANKLDPAAVRMLELLQTL